MIRLVRADNPGPMTLDGTNSYLLGVERPIVVDPGPVAPGHLAALAAYGTPRLILLTHHHLDHSASAPVLAERWRCPVRALDPALCIAAEPLRDGETVVADGVEVEVVAAPGHTADSISLLMGDRLLTGDTVLGRGTTVIAAPDGDLGAYFASLDRLIGLVAARGVARLLPGHGPEIVDPADRLRAYRRHRLERLAQVRAAVAAGADTVDDIVTLVYAGIDAAVLPAAHQAVAAQLRYLRSIPPG